MRGSRDNVTRNARELIRRDREYRAANETHRLAEEARRVAAASLEQARDNLCAGIERGESLLCDGHLIMRLADGYPDVIEMSRVVRLD